MSEPYVRHVQLLGFEKRFSPSQHYVYMFMVKWQDLTEKLVYRKYTDIYEFHVVDTVLKTEIKISFSAIPRHGGLGEELRSYRELTLTSSAQQHAGEKELKEKFPIESGDIKKEHRTIPHLPAPKWFDGLRSTENRQVTLADYCSSLLNLPPKISRCPHVLNFFKVRPDDVNPTASSNGRKPETFLLKTDNTKKNVSDITGPIILQSYRAIADYAKNTKTELSVKAGDVVDVVEKNENGWWFCQMTNKRGWVPGAYLEPLDSPDESEEQDPNYEGELHVTTQDYSGELEDELSIQQGETVEVIHKLLDGWWVVRRGSKNGYFPAMYLQKSGDAPVAGNKTKNLPPRRRTISNANSIHTQKRKEISQETYRRNSKKYLKQRQSIIDAVKSLTIEEQNENENKAKAQPAIPPRPSKELILDKCSEHTKNKIQTVN